MSIFNNLKKNKEFISEIFTKENMEISYECALEYFIEMDLNSSSYSYLESASYVLFISDNLLFAIHKQTGTKSVFMEIIKNRPELIDKKMICTYMDMIYYVSDNNLCYYNLDTNKKGTIMHLTEEIKDDGTNFTVENISIYKGNKLIAGNRFLKIVDLETEKIEDIKDIKLKPLSSDKKYFIHNDYLYFADTINPDDHTYKIYNYNINSGVTNEASDVLFTNLIIKDGIVDNYYFIIESDRSRCKKHDQSSIKLFKIKETGEIELAGVRNLSGEIFQIQNFGKNLIYVDIANNYNLTRYDIINNTKKILVKNFKIKVPFFRKRILVLDIITSYFNLKQDRLLFAEEYMLIGKWLLYRKDDKSQPKIIPVC